jgi:hypothetical protein
LDDVLAEIVESRIISISYANPQTYLQFIGKLANIEIEDKAFGDDLEIKATKDLLIHNSGVSNAIYLAKAGAQARIEVGQVIPIYQAYFNHCVATIKRISGIVSRDVARAFPEKKDTAVPEEGDPLAVEEQAETSPEV